ncbi:MAG: ABC transporter permease [Acidobacteria bacterium]|nr:ABC transporter permease [Acidobacteriota bacterium]
MRAELHLARRYLIGLGRRTHVATVSAISLLSLALGVLALVVTLSLLDGFQSTIKRGILAQSAHARIEPARGRVLHDPAELVSILHRELPDVGIVEIVQGTCLVRGIGDAVPAHVEGRSDMEAPAIDSVLAARIGAGAGERINVISPRRRLTPMGPVPVHAVVRVNRVAPRQPGVDGGVLLLPLAQAQRLLWGHKVVEALELRTFSDPWRLAGTVRSVLAGHADQLRIKGVRELHHSLLLALSLERIMIFFAVGLMLVIAALNLLCNVAMVAAEKRTDLAVLAGLGLGPRALRRLFVALGLGIGVLGAALGAAGGTLLAVVLDRTKALPLPRGIFIVDAVPFRVDPLMVLTVTGLALALSAVASWLPARLVARRDPAEGLRYE